jgi:hypothetical protein
MDEVKDGNGKRGCNKVRHAKILRGRHQWRDAAARCRA